MILSLRTKFIFRLEAVSDRRAKRFEMKNFAILILPALILSTLIFFGACTINSSTANKILAPVTPVSLTAVSAKFHTSSDDKDDDTKFDIALKNNDNKVIAEAKNVFGKYEENSDHSVPLEKKGDFGKRILTAESSASTSRPTALTNGIST
jgi:hypothetical protein